MRHVVYLLLLANLAYLGWNLFQVRTGSEQVRELPPLPPTAKRLVTLQELQQREQQQVQEQEGQLQQQEQRQQQQAQAKAQDAQLRVQQEDTAQEGQDIPEDPEALAEEQMQEDVLAIEAVTQAEPPGAGVSMLCQSLGPFLVTEQLEAVAARLAELGLESSRRSTETQVENGWWVYLPSMPRPEAMEIVQLLEDNNDREYYVGKDNFIALGTFNVLSRAERRMQSAHRLGLEPLLEARYQTQITHWLDLRVTGALDGDLAWITEDYPELQLEPQSCR